MAFDGITIANITKELSDSLIDGRIYKIAQPENDEILLTVRRGKEQYRLLASANASLPLIYLITDNKPSPMTAPNFCMLLRKHVQNGRITEIYQPGLERIIRIGIEHLNELGDLCKKYLFIEIMGKHSNIIFCDEDFTIIDSIKHVSGMVSSVREVLPGRPYFIPDTQEKKNPLAVTESDFIPFLTKKALPTYKALYMSFTGLSPVISQELCFQADIDSDRPVSTLNETERESLQKAFFHLISQISSSRFSPCILYENNVPVEFCSFPLTMYGFDAKKTFDSISELLYSYYAEKNMITRIRQKSSELRRIVQTDLERNIKKYDLQLKQIADTEKKETYKVYGELINTYGYNTPPGSKSLTAQNYYDENKTIVIPLNPLLSPSENAKKYFEKYNKLKRTNEALSTLTIQVKAEIDHLESILSSLDIALLEEDLTEIKEELIESGYIRRKGGTRKVKVTSHPFHYISSDSYDIYVGKNNFQNDELTFHFASGNDWWFHAKGMPGSHVLVKSKNNEQPPDRVFEEAGSLAAYYSKGRGTDKIEIDYTLKKNVKKPGGGKPGFVVYYTNYSLMADSDISHLTQIS